MENLFLFFVDNRTRNENVTFIEFQITRIYIIYTLHLIIYKIAFKHTSIFIY